MKCFYYSVTHATGFLCGSAKINGDEFPVFDTIKFLEESGYKKPIFTFIYQISENEYEKINVKKVVLTKKTEDDNHSQVSESKG